MAFHQLSKIFPSLREKDLLYAANWTVSLLQVTITFSFSSCGDIKFSQATVVTLIGLVGCIYTGLDTRATDLAVN